MEQFIYIIFGWLLGLLAPSIVERIRRLYRTNDLIDAINAELHEHTYLMAIVAYQLNKYSGKLTDEFLDWFESIVTNYKGEEPSKSIEEIIPLLREIPQAKRYDEFHPNGDDGKGVGLMEYNLPLLNIHLNEIALLPIKSQTSLLRILKKQGLYNQRVVFLKQQLEKTFSPLSDTNHEIVLKTLKAGYLDLAKDSKKIAELASQQVKKKSWFNIY